MINPQKILDRFSLITTGVSPSNLRPGDVIVVATRGRTYAAPSPAMIEAKIVQAKIELMAIQHFGDCAVVDVHPVVVTEIARLAWKLNPGQLMRDEFFEKAVGILQSALSESLLFITPVLFTFCHPGNALPIAVDGKIRAVVMADIDMVQDDKMSRDLLVEEASIARGETFGLFKNDRLIAFAHTHDAVTPEMANLVASVGIGVAEAYRGLGYGKALLLHWSHVMQLQGRVCLYETSSSNEASIALAGSAGYVEYGRSRQVFYAT